MKINHKNGISNYVKVITLVIFAVFLPAATCNVGGKVTPNPPVITDQHACSAACSNLEQLGCDEARPINMGRVCKIVTDCKGLDGQPDKRQECIAGTCTTSCTNFCIETENQGVWLDPVCVSKITECKQIDSCPLAQKPTPTCEGPACPPDIRTK